VGSIREMHELQQGMARSAQRLKVIREELKDSFGKRLSALLASGNIDGFVSALPISLEGLLQLDLLVGEYDSQILAAALNSGDFRKRFFIELAYSRPEAIRTARMLSQKEMDRILGFFNKEAKIGLVRSLSSKADRIWAVQHFGVAPEFEDGFFCELTFSELQTLAAIYPGKVSDQIISRGNGSGLREGERASDYWILIAELAPVEKAESFFESKVDEYSALLRSADGELMLSSDEDMILMNCIAILSPRSERAREEWLPIFNLQDIPDSPDYLLDAICSQKGRARYDLAKKAAGMWQFRRIYFGRAQRILESTDLDDPYSYAALLVLLPGMRMLQSTVERLTGEIPSDWHLHFVLDYFSKCPVPIINKELIQIPFVRRMLEKWIGYFTSELTSFSDGVISGCMIDDGRFTESGEDVLKAMRNAGGKFSIASAAYSRERFMQNGGLYHFLRDEYYMLSEEDKRWVDRHVVAAISHFKFSLDSGWGFALAVGNADRIQGRLKKNKETRGRIRCACYAAKMQIDDFIALSSAIGRSEDVVWALYHMGWRFRVLAAAVDPKAYERVIGSIVEQKKAYAKLDALDRKWVDERTPSGNAHVFRALLK